MAPRGAPAHRQLPDDADVIAPDGSEVRLLASTARGSMAEFRLHPGQTTIAVVHQTVTELWFVVAGVGQIWLGVDEAGANGAAGEVIELVPGQSVSIETGTPFQFRATGSEPLRIVGVTMPPWPGEDEAQAVPGKWTESGLDLLP